MKLLKWLNENFEKYILVASLVVMIVIIFVQVVLRYCFGTTISWGEELTRYIMLYQIWIGAAYAVKEDAHLRITTFRDKFSKKNSMRIENGVLVLWMAFAAFISVKGVELVDFLMGQGQLSPAMQLPMWVAYMSVPLGCLLIFIRLIQKLYHNIVKTSAMEVNDK